MNSPTPPEVRLIVPVATQLITRHKVEFTPQKPFKHYSHKDNKESNKTDGLGLKTRVTEAEQRRKHKVKEVIVEGSERRYDHHVSSRACLHFSIENIWR